MVAILSRGRWDKPQLIPANMIVVVKWQMKTDVRNIMLIIIDNLGGTKIEQWLIRGINWGIGL